MKDTSRRYCSKRDGEEDAKAAEMEETWLGDYSEQKKPQCF
jgi:hypothetical protein